MFYLNVIVILDNVTFSSHVNVIVSSYVSLLMWKVEDLHQLEKRSDHMFHFIVPYIDCNVLSENAACTIDLV
jgi:hypothetical protein